MKAVQAALALALCSCLAGALAAEFEPLANPGGPPFMRGVVLQKVEPGVPIRSAGYLLPDAIAILKMHEDGTVHLKNATITSWECGAEDGSFRMLLDMEEGMACEYGILDLETKQLRWAASMKECPGEGDLEFEDVMLKTEGLVNVCAKSGGRSD